jgi:RimJ/RimL family protein N-acetyltransferase
VPPALSVETPRLLATVPAAEDLDFLCALLGDPRVGATLGGVRDRAAVEKLIALHRAECARDGFGFWIWRDRATGEPVARGGVRRTTVEGDEVVEVGWSVRPDRWGHGIATELGAASLRVAADHGIAAVVAFTLPHNVASRRVMEKLGMVYDRTFEHGPWGPHVLYLAQVDAAHRDG